MKKLKEHRIKIGNITITHFKLNKNTYIHINLGRYKKGKIADTWTIYDGIMEKHKHWDDIWADFQDKKLIGIEIHLRD